MIEPISVDLVSLNLASLAPMLIAVFGALVILCIDLINKNLHKSFYVMLTVLFLIVDLGAVLGYSGATRGFFDLMLVDGISILSQIIIIIASALFILLALSQQRFHEYRYPEYFALFLFMVAGFQFMVSSDNLILIFVGLETASMALYTMIAMHNREKSLEAAVKYFTMGAFAAACFAFGVMIFYAITGSMELSQISAVLVQNNFEPFPAVLLGVVFMLVALGFKLSLVPFHIWAPDVYEGSSSAMAGYMSIVPKIAAFVVALRFFEIFVSANIFWVEVILYGIVVITMTLPNMIALVQEDIKRMLAYSSISHAGFVMAAILLGTTQATQGLFLYWALFLFTNLGAFAMLWVHRQKRLEGYATDHPFAKFSGLVKKSPMTASIMGLFMLSLAGIPPFSLFWGKMYLIGSAVNADYIILALIMAANSAIAAYYYLKLIVYMFLKEPIADEKVEFLGNANNTLKTVIGVSALVTLMAIFFINPLLEIISYYVQSSGF
ncbi:NADH-quinone oxidoreductase subunit NuoN [Arcobacter sp. FWKO B]|uniref:NADH-quinone oxidoreductase subunit NuoN n=1 Tax=Arcobacter sp. FWKO B TaxID=2593672 RepID=UPI0018A4711E|nr:NADH-quinone oxidoreductase subunit NuoN [Arcobacter sp. FWKO B]QOG12193.1 NADH-quinone oxidoreductase subunit NuoN [Arcobacter sp. FWKO B]